VEALKARPAMPFGRGRNTSARGAAPRTEEQSPVNNPKIRFIPNFTASNIHHEK